ncbi:uncharacterized protein CcaverHIS019_0106380 [Cutaneotrichosporon cavernicola]|uniref:glucan 1,3-beta-glucosidase n=1 Tax=Cutaneotrichosporon cavernicola TaxID=279322 RepID=A0AA48L093_9TREE|nr:uncharacterized protein CcaverHIS019_0106380 [Cutaneotrichosporon cavernicola]BEI87920.1 hypothetical protein CcaverHIS019_0106380 [Cutaneotrichosporon cavernicola]BEI95694.1 hypothetical protein CcaverHIS631_0106430 [Cutaneotrichosporon cavernicola]BEJ03468.1 hypothetical protein CcaverHIS641_0106430 [Cutaneotrichosporon cavernicola]
MAEKPYTSEGAARNRKWLWVSLAALAAVGVALGVGLGVGLNVNKKGADKGSASAGGEPSGDVASTEPPANPSTPVTNTPNPVRGGTGGNGSVVTTDLNATFTYLNEFGGTWAYDPTNPFNVSGQAQSWTPPLTEEWVWGKDIARGVNLGGWLVTEPFIVPALYEKYNNATPKAVDEYTLSQAMGANLAKEMEEHYNTFITEKDFADIAAAGLNWVRIPIGYWAIGTQGDEPYLEKVSWAYFTKAISWGRKYGIRILLDLHSLPGSQNGWNHSGRSGTINWMRGAMGLANAQRSLEYLRSFTQYISQPGVKEVVPMLGLVNEVLYGDVGKDAMGSFYFESIEMIRGITGSGKGNGPLVAFHDGFQGPANWDGFLTGADRLVMDQHPYLAFGGVNQNPWPQQTQQACGWGGGVNDTAASWGVIIGGEWSLATNDCGMWLNGVDVTGQYATTYGSCTQFEDWRTWDATFKQNLLNHAMGSMDALQNFFFWTWRIGDSTVRGYAASPMWHYQLGLEQGWLPKDPRVAGGFCKRNGYCPGCAEFAGTYPASATGGASQAIVAAESASYSNMAQAIVSPAWIVGSQSLLPTLTQTGTPITLAVPAESAKWLSGWTNPNDKVGAWVQVAGCPYPGAYDGNDASAMPSALCGADGVGAAQAPAAVPVPTATPTPTAPVAPAPTTDSLPADPAAAPTTAPVVPAARR